MSSDYSEKLKDPRWQKKRLDVFGRDRWCCQICGNNKITLNVHHLYYAKDKDPWEYPLSAFETLCEDCHTKDRDTMKCLGMTLRAFLNRKSFLLEQVESLKGQKVNG